MNCARLTVWGPRECRKIHQASLRLLAETGVEVTEPEARDVLHDLGASLQGSRVRMGSELVESALAMAPRRWRLGTRPDGTDFELNASSSYFGTGSDCLYVRDPENGDRRRTRLADVERMAAVCEQLENIDFVMSMGLPSDVPSSIDDLAQLAALLRRTRKPVVTTPKNGQSVSLMVAMAHAVGRREGIAVYAMSSPPLVHDEHALSKLHACAERSVPVIYAPAPAAGATAPASLAATVVVGNAEVLSGLVYHQAIRPGAPFIYGVGCGMLDMHSGVDVYAVPEHMLGNHAGADLARFYGLPSFSYAGVSDSKLLDEQWAVEIALTTILGALSRATLLHDVGYLESGLQSSCESIVAGNELVGYARAFMKHVSVDGESVAQKEISAVGPGGSHLSRAYTRKHHKAFWKSTLFDHDPHGRWQRAGALTLGERLRQRTKLLLASPVNCVLNAAGLETLDDCLRQAVEEAAPPFPAEHLVRSARHFAPQWQEE